VVPPPSAGWGPEDVRLVTTTRGIYIAACLCKEMPAIRVATLTSEAGMTHLTATARPEAGECAA